MGLIAHQLEKAGIATTAISTAKDITESVRTPRSVFLDFPQGYTTGKTGDRNLTINIVQAALSLLDETEEETLTTLPYSWGDDDSWKDTVFQIPESGSGATDNRLERSDLPQYQTDLDMEQAKEKHAEEECLLCSGIDY